MAKWYYLVDGQEIGPLESADLKRLVTTGQLNPTDKVRRADMVEVYQASQIKGLFQPSSAAPPIPAASKVVVPTTTHATSDTPPQHASHNKRIFPALLLALFLGGLGAHRFYAGRRGTAQSLLLMTLLGFGATFIGSVGGLSAEDASASLAMDKESSDRQVLDEFDKNDLSSEGLARLDARLAQRRVLQEKRMELQTQADRDSEKSDLWFLFGQALLLVVGIWIIVDVISLMSGSFKDGKGRLITEWT